MSRARLPQQLLSSAAGVQELSGSMHAEAGGVLALAVRHTLAGVMAGEASGVLSLTIPAAQQELAGSMDAVAGGVLALVIHVPLSGSMAGEAGGVLSLSGTEALAGVMAGVAGGVLTLSILGQEELSGVMAAEAGGVLSLAVIHQLRGVMAGEAGGVLRLRATHPLPGEHYPPGVHVITPVNHAATLRVGDTALFLFPSAGIEGMAALCRVLAITYRTGELVASLELQKLEDAGVPTFSRTTGVGKPQTAQNTPAKRIARAGRTTTRSGRRWGEPGRGQ